MTSQVFEFQEYRSFLKETLTNRRGSIGEVAQFLNCQSSFISQVITERTHLNLEQAFKVAKFLELSKEEVEYFLLLVQIERAGSEDLKNFFAEKKKKFVSNRKLIKERIKNSENITSQHQAVYYSNWWYAAAHLLVALPGFQTLEAISKKLNLSQHLVREIIEFLLKAGLIEEKNKKLHISKTRIHVDKDSVFRINHHLHWRSKVAQMISNSRTEDLNFSALIGVSNEDFELLKKFVLDLIERSEKTIQTSKEEDLFLFNIDLLRFR